MESNTRERDASCGPFVELITRISIVPLNLTRSLRGALSNFNTLFETARSILRSMGSGLPFQLALAPFHVASWRSRY